jgi:hypothetical protein
MIDKRPKGMPLHSFDHGSGMSGMMPLPPPTPDPCIILYYVNTGIIFFILELGGSVSVEPEYAEIKDELVDLCSALVHDESQNFGTAYDMDIYIRPLFRNKRIDNLLT